MPRRPRSHQLETESENAFRTALPSGWVYRSQPLDYGIDGIVEIFEEDRATGLFFHVQLKATDSPKAARSVPLSSDTGSYYSSLDSPVLLVRYYAPEKLLFVKWWHAFDPHYKGSTSRSLSVPLSSTDLWSHTAPKSIADSVRAFRSLRKKLLKYPIIFILKAQSGHDHPALRELMLRARSAAKGHFDIIDFRTVTPELLRGNDQLSAEITVAESQIVVDLSGVLTTTLHAQEISGHDIVAASALTLVRADNSHRSGSLLLRCLPESALLGNDDAVNCLGFNLCANRHFAEVVELMISLLDRGDQLGRRARRTLGMVLAPRGDVRKEPRYGDLLQRDIEIAHGDNDVAELARAHYNFANWLSGQDNDKALREYRLSEAIDSDYRTRWYFNRDVADVLFNMNAYAAAANRYRESYDQAAETETLGLVAKSLLFDGRYGDAAAAFGRYLELEPHPDPRWVVLPFVLPGIRGWSSTDAQTRNPELAVEIHLPRDDYTDERVLDTTAAALRVDALCGSAWFNRGIAFAHGEDWRSACVAFLASTIGLAGDAVAWANAMRSAYNGRIAEWFEIVLRAGYWDSGQDFVDELMMPGDGMTFRPDDEVWSIIESVIRHGRGRRTFDMRFFDSSSS